MTVVTESVKDALKSRIRQVPDFPKPGILFYDITSLLKDASGFRLAIDALSRPYHDRSIDVVAAIESRGFILGAAVADRLGVGFVPVRKLGKLPAKRVQVSYALEYGSDCLEIHEDAIAPGQRVLVLDDVLATGGTAKAALELVRGVGGVVDSVAFLIELTFLNGRRKLEDTPIFSVLEYAS
jgi:adenine phosphoribosyltransferase